MNDADGAKTLTSAEAKYLLEAVVSRDGGRLLSYALDHVDASPGRSTTATYRTRIARPQGNTNETIGVTIRANGPNTSDRKAKLFAQNGVQAACWFYPNDPDLPGLAHASDPVAMSQLLRRCGLPEEGSAPEDLTITLIRYRPRRRAVLRCRTASGVTVYVKACRESDVERIRVRHEILTAAKVPCPKVLVTTDDYLLVLTELSGHPLSKAIFDESRPVTAQGLLTLLDSLPHDVMRLERRPPWASSVRHYASVVSARLPSEERRLNHLAQYISTALAPLPLGEEPTHGDFYEAQIYVNDGQVTGLLDIDTVGPGRRADDLACLLAHLACIQRMDAAQTERVRRLARGWMAAFDSRVDPWELRLRAAGVAISLATGPFRSQEPQWERETKRMIDIADGFVKQAVQIGGPRVTGRPHGPALDFASAVVSAAPPRRDRESRRPAPVG
ncbi:MAG: aminoglycoside phosphotransferase family protein [Propionibacteriaceae bacterium]|jgi:aminoglycoside phosphotransferase|nr:aminoglycoside phosphotransferase family protein [Propionibacteriaceae bacterium]